MVDDNKIYNFANDIKGIYNIAPGRSDDFENSLTDFEMVIIREDNCRVYGIKPYDFISQHLQRELLKDIKKEFGVDLTDSQLLQLIELIAKKVYELCRSELATVDRFDKEINHIIDKYYEKYEMAAFGEMYDKCDIYDEVGREKFIEVRMEKWNKVLKNTKKEILNDVVLSGLYEEDSPENQELTENIILPEISKALATFERNDLEGGLRKDTAEQYKKSWEER